MRKLNKFFAIAILMAVASLSAPHAFAGVVVSSITGDGGDTATMASALDGYTLGSIVGPIYQIAGIVIGS